MFKESDEERFAKYNIQSNMEVLLADLESLSTLEETKENLKETMIVGNWELIEKVEHEQRNGICEFCGKRNLKWAYHIKNVTTNVSYMIGGNCLEKKTTVWTHQTVKKKMENWEIIAERIKQSVEQFDEQIEEFIEWGLPQINVQAGLLGIDLEIKDIIDELLEVSKRKVALGRLKTIAHNMHIK